MSNEERVNLNINIQLQSLRAAFSELTKLQNKVKEIETGKVSAANAAVTSKPWADYDAQARRTQEMSQRNEYKYKAGVAERRAAMKQFEMERQAGIAKIVDMEANAAMRNDAYRQRTADRIIAERNIKSEMARNAVAEAKREVINSENEAKAFEKKWMAEFKTTESFTKETTKLIESEKAKQIARTTSLAKAEAKTNVAIQANAANASKKVWTDAIKQAFSLHIVQMYVQPFVQAVNQLLRTTLTTFAEFDRYYADYMAKSADFANVVSREEIFKDAVSQVYSINNMADAMERFSASGIDLTQNQQALTDVLHLSVTAAITYDDAANTVIKTQEAFQLSINDSTMIVDALTNSANASTAELKDLTEWFGYASGMSHEAGINVQQLAAYLGILSSMGMKSAGTAFRQMLVQMTDTNVRDKLNAVFGQDFDYMDMDQTILRMRAYVQTSSNQAEVIQRISGALGGKVNAREALARLLTADDQTWNRIMTATERSGTAAQLFEDMTDNAAASMDKIKNNITLILAQIGQVFAPILEGIVWITGGFAQLMNATPKFIKQLMGLGILGTAVFATLIMGLVSVVGLYYMAFAANQSFAGGMLKNSFSVKQLCAQLSLLAIELVEHITLTNASAVANERAAEANALNVQISKSMRYGMLAGIGAMISYMGYQYAMEQQAYSLATALNYVTSILAGITAGAMVGGPIGALLGGAVALGSAYTGQSSIDRAKEESTLSRRNSAWYGKNDVTQYNDTGAKSYFTINNMNLSGVQEPANLAAMFNEESESV